MVKKKDPNAWKKKEWYSIISPEMFESKEVGTTPADDEKKLLNRMMLVPLRDITGNMNHQFCKLFCRVTEVKGKSVYTQFEGFEYTREYIRRNVRRRRSIITAIETVESKDGRKMQFVAYAFTARKVDTSKKDAIRKEMLQTMEKVSKGNTFNELINKALFGQMASDIFKNVKLVAPVKRIEIAKCEVLRGK